MRKVVINTIYGGFSLSYLAIKRYNELAYPNTPFYYYRYGKIIDNEKGKIPFKKAEERDFDHHNYSGIIYALDKDFGDAFKVKPNTESYEDFRKHIKIFNYDIPRDDQFLVQVVEELGEKAEDKYSRLKIVEVEDKYRIICYDGVERIETPNDIKWY